MRKLSRLVGSVALVMCPVVALAGGLGISVSTVIDGLKPFSPRCRPANDGTSNVLCDLSSPQFDGQLSNVYLIMDGRNVNGVNGIVTLRADVVTSRPNRTARLFVPFIEDLFIAVQPSWKHTRRMLRDRANYAATMAVANTDGADVFVGNAELSFVYSDALHALNFGGQ